MKALRLQLVMPLLAGWDLRFMLVITSLGWAFLANQLSHNARLGLGISVMFVAPAFILWQTFAKRFIFLRADAVRLQLPKTRIPIIVAILSFITVPIGSLALLTSQYSQASASLVTSISVMMLTAVTASFAINLFATYTWLTFYILFTMICLRIPGLPKPGEAGFPALGLLLTAILALIVVLRYRHLVQRDELDDFLASRNQPDSSIGLLKDVVGTIADRFARLKSRFVASTDRSSKIPVWRMNDPLGIMLGGPYLMGLRQAFNGTIAAVVLLIVYTMIFSAVFHDGLDRLRKQAELYSFFFGSATILIGYLFVNRLVQLCKKADGELSEIALSPGLSSGDIRKQLLSAMILLPAVAIFAGTIVQIVAVVLMGSNSASFFRITLVSLTAWLMSALANTAVIRRRFSALYVSFLFSTIGLLLPAFIAFQATAISDQAAISRSKSIFTILVLLILLALPLLWNVMSIRRSESVLARR